MLWSCLGHLGAWYAWFHPDSKASWHYIRPMQWLHQWCSESQPWKHTPNLPKERPSDQRNEKIHAARIPSKLGWQYTSLVPSRAKGLIEKEKKDIICRLIWKLPPRKLHGQTLFRGATLWATCDFHTGMDQLKLRSCSRQEWCSVELGTRRLLSWKLLSTGQAIRGNSNVELLRYTNRLTPKLGFPHCSKRPRVYNGLISERWAKLSMVLAIHDTIHHTFSSHTPRSPLPAFVDLWDPRRRAPTSAQQSILPRILGKSIER